MKELHRLLKRQLKRHMGYTDAVPEEMRPFLEAVSEAYKGFDDDRALLERSLELSSNELYHANSEMHAIFQTMPDQYFQLDEGGSILNYKEGTMSHHYLSCDHPVGRHLDTVMNKEIADSFKEAIAQVIKQEKPRSFEFSFLHEATLFYYEARVLPLLETQSIVLVRDISERKSAEKHIAHLAYHDSLTGLPNRLMFKERLEQAVAVASRRSWRVAVMFLDLDRFKQVNDTLGHSAGDRMLVTVAERLQESVRITDTIARLDDTVIARMGGDEFTIILNEIEDPHTVARIAQRILKKVAKPIIVGNNEIFTSASIGVAFYPDDGKDPETLLKNADTAMYHAKERGKNNCQMYADSMNAEALDRLNMEADLRHAVENDDLDIYYQPQLDLSSGKICGMEALLRWKHPERGFIPPGVFIPLAEESDLIIQISDWVLRHACAQNRIWLDEGYDPLRIYVNLSPHQLRDGNLEDMLSEVLDTYDLSPEYIGLEMTESVIMQYPIVAARTLLRLREMGILIALDDFGTGYSSLGHLNDFPIDVLKIDHSFIRDLINDPNNAVIAKTIITMGQNLGLSVIAEGVETEEQLKFLRRHRCDMIQGFLLCSPLPPDQVYPILQRSRNR